MDPFVGLCLGGREQRGELARITRNPTCLLPLSFSGLLAVELVELKGISQSLPRKRSAQRGDIERLDPPITATATRKTVPPSALSTTTSPRSPPIRPFFSVHPWV